MTNRTPFLFFAPAFALLGFVLLSPVVYGFWFSLNRIDYGAPVGYAGLLNYYRVIESDTFVGTIARTALHTSLSVLLTALVSLALAVWIDTLRPRAAAIVQTIVIIPWIISTVVATLLFRWVFVNDIGIAAYVIGKVVGPVGDLLTEPSGAMGLLVLVSVWKRVGYAVIVVLAGLKSIPGELNEAARIDGASSFQIFRRITLPLLKTPLLLVLVVLTLANINTVETPLILTGGGPRDATKTLAIDVYERAFSVFDLGSATSLAIMMFCANIVLVFAYVRLSRWKA